MLRGGLWELPIQRTCCFWEANPALASIFHSSISKPCENTTKGPGRPVSSYSMGPAETARIFNCPAPFPRLPRGGVSPTNKSWLVKSIKESCGSLRLHRNAPSTPTGQEHQTKDGRFRGASRRPEILLVPGSNCGAGRGQPCSGNVPGDPEPAGGRVAFRSPLPAEKYPASALPFSAELVR